MNPWSNTSQKNCTMGGGFSIVYDGLSHGVKMGYAKKCHVKSDKLV